MKTNRTPKQKLMLAAGGATTTIILGSSLLAHGAFAASSTSTNPESNLVQEIATKFHLNSSDVQSVFDQNRTEHEAAEKQSQADKLTAAVTAGEITSAQKDLITAKLAELDASRQAAMSSGTKPTQAQREADMTALKKWATDNNIDMKWLRPAGGPGGHGRGHGGPDLDGGTPPADAPSSSSSSTPTSGN
jgi:hypothetical protein